MDWLNFWDFSMLSESFFWIGTIIFCLFAYMIGSINAGQLLSLVGPKDLGKEGSHNYGATNAGRVYGPKTFVFIFLFDMLKTFFAVVILMSISTKGTFKPLDNTLIENTEYVFFYASIPISLIFVIIGHSFPIYFGFKGGKGVSSSFGYLIIINWLIAIIAILIFFIIIYISRRAFWGSMISITVGCVLIFITQVFFMESSPTNEWFFYWTNSWLMMISAFVIWLIVVSKHKSNIIKMIENKDPFIQIKK